MSGSIERDQMAGEGEVVWVTRLFERQNTNFDRRVVFGRRGRNCFRPATPGIKGVRPVCAKCETV